MSAHTHADLAPHVGHTIECVSYAFGENIALECIDCNVVLLDFNEDDEEEDAMP